MSLVVRCCVLVSCAGVLVLHCPDEALWSDVVLQLIVLHCVVCDVVFYAYTMYSLTIYILYFNVHK